MMKTPRHNGGAVHSRSMRKRTQTTVAAVVCKKGFYMSEYLYTEAQVRGKLCGFGIAADPERYVRVQKYEPQTIKFAFTSRERGGLGYTEICTFLNEHCKTNIVIPEIEQGVLSETT